MIQTQLGQSNRRQRPTKRLWFPVSIRWVGLQRKPSFGLFLSFMGYDKHGVGRFKQRVRLWPLHIELGHTMPKRLASKKKFISLSDMIWRDSVSDNTLESMELHKRINEKSIHDGLLTYDGTKVDFYDKDCSKVSISGGFGENDNRGVVLNETQALGLLDWLEQNRTLIQKMRDERLKAIKI